MEYSLSDKEKTIRDQKIVPLMGSILRITTLLKIYLFLNIYKPLLGILLGKSTITAFTLLILLFVFICLLLNQAQKKHIIIKGVVYPLVIMLLLTFHLIYSFLFGEAGMLAATVTAYMQLVTPIMLLALVRSLALNLVVQLAAFLDKILLPVIVFGLIELLTPLDIRLRIYSYFSLLTTGKAGLNVAYYLGDTAYGGLRLGSILFDPLTFGFLSSFYVIRKIALRRKQISVPFLVNFFSLGKLPLFSTFVSVFNKIIPRRISVFYYILAGLTVMAYFVLNFNNIINNNPSMANHLIGLASGIANGLEKPFLGHGLGTAGYVSYLLFLSRGVTGPFYRELHYFNGNESTVGMLVYQVGFIIAILYLLMIIGIFFDVHKKHSRMMSGCIFAYFVSMFLSESVLSVTVVSVLMIFAYSKYERA